ncbi:MAG: thiamine-phosphate pyrophosphorylase [Candidatus Omnitrophica bacterium]|nr:thiamine-phosphate pyrophosphorylase [Candidatus Omnitrophota bacterium]
MNKTLRLVDANLNRSREGLRVCEDIARFILNDKKLTRSFKILRHRIGALTKRLNKENAILLKSRNVKKDIGRKTGFREGKRKNIPDIFCANAERAKESLRVLEEIAKLLNKRTSESFKKIRFRVYELEKKSRIKLESLRHN